LQGVSFGAGVTIRALANGVREVAPGGRALFVANLAAFELRYGTNLPIAGEFTLNSNLSNDGERLTLLAADASPIVSFVYGTTKPWPVPDGESLVLMHSASSDPSDPVNWRESTAANGAPGADDRLRYSLWQAAHFPNDDPNASVVGAPLADPDEDGSQNLAEFFLGTLPRIATLQPSLPTAIQVPVLINGVAQIFPAFMFRYMKAAEEIAFAAETTTDLREWGHEALVLSGTPFDHGDGTETRIYRAAEPLEHDGQRFFRLRLELK